MSLTERIAQARSIVEGANERFTPLRAHVLELIIEDGKAVKAYDLLDRLKPDVGSPKPPTVETAHIAILQSFLSAKNATPWKNDTHMITQNVSLKASRFLARLSSIMESAQTASPKNGKGVSFAK